MESRSWPAGPRDGTPNATLAGRVELTASVARFVVRPDGGRPAFRPGQYMALGLTVDDRLLQRPYSTASAASGDGELEFFIRRVPGGALTPLLWELPVGARLRLGRPKGRFTLIPGDERVHLFLATGTGLAPFVSMLSELQARGRPARVIILHGVSYAAELGYRDRFERWRARGRSVTYVPSVSRPAAPGNAGWNGRTGRLDAILGPVSDELAIDPQATVAYLCGNPEMIAAGERILAARGVPPDAIRSEHYWTAGSGPSVATA